MTLPATPSLPEYLDVVDSYMEEFGEDTELTVPAWAKEVIDIHAIQMLEIVDREGLQLIMDSAPTSNIHDLVNEFRAQQAVALANIAGYMFMVGALAERKGWDTGLYVVDRV